MLIVTRSFGAGLIGSELVTALVHLKRRKQVTLEKVADVGGADFQVGFEFRAIIRESFTEEMRDDALQIVIAFTRIEIL